MSTFLTVYKESEIEARDIEGNKVALSNKEYSVFHRDIKKRDKDALKIEVSHEKIFVSYKHFFSCRIDEKRFIDLGQGYRFSNVMLGCLFTRISNCADSVKDEIDIDDNDDNIEISFSCFSDMYYSTTNLEGMNEMLETNFKNYDELDKAQDEQKIDYITSIISTDEKNDEILFIDW